MPFLPANQQRQSTEGFTCRTFNGHEILICVGLCWCRGRESVAEAEPDGVLAAQVLPALWHQQGQVGRGLGVPIELPARRPVVRIYAARAGASLAAVIGGHHRRAA